LAGLLFERLHDDAIEIGGDAGARVAVARGALLGQVGRLAGQELVERCSDGVDVGALVDAVRSSLLGWPISRCADGRRSRQPGGQPRDPEIDELCARSSGSSDPMLRQLPAMSGARVRPMNDLGGGRTWSTASLPIAGVRTMLRHQTIERRLRGIRHDERLSCAVRSTSDPHDRVMLKRANLPFLKG
jgi:hypothetical protein